MAKGGPKQTVNQQPDAASQAYINQQRQMGLQAAQTANQGPAGGGSWFTGPNPLSIGDQAAQFMNPYTQNVVDATRGEFDHLRNQASVDASQNATLAGAYGGTRHGVAEGTRLAALDRAQGSTIAGLLNSGYQNAVTQGTQYSENQRQLQEQQLQEPLFRAQNGLTFANQGLGPVGTATVQGQQPDRWGGALKGVAGGAMTGAAFGPGGAAIGGGLGGLFGYLGG